MRNLAFAYGFFLPFTSVLAISGWLNMPAIVGMIAVVAALLYRRHPLVFADWLTLFCLAAPALASSVVNIEYIVEPKFVNHLATYIFVYFVYYLAPRALFHHANEALWAGALVGLVVALLYEALEFTLGLAGQWRILEMVPRSSVSTYSATYGGFVLRARSLAEESGHFALYLGCVGALVLGYLVQAKVSARSRYVLVLSLVCGILLTFSTSGVVFSLLCSLVVAVLHVSPGWRKARVLSLGLLFVAMVYGSALVLFGLDLFTIVTHKLDDLNGRAPRFVESLEYFKSATFSEVAFGMGPGYYDYRGLPSVVTFYGLTAFQTGVVGLMSLLILLGYYVYRTTCLPLVVKPYFQFSLLFAILVYGGISNYWYPWLWFLFAAINDELKNNDSPGARND